MNLLSYSATLDFKALAGARASLPARQQIWLFAAFLAAFALKVPMFPLHTWQPNAHTEAPTAGSVILAGILLKMGAYGFLRVSIPILPDGVRFFLKPMLIISAVAIVYGAYVTLVQTDVKRLIAFSSVSHMGFATLGILTLTQRGVEGATLQMINHGIISGALFLCVGMIYERTHTREIKDYGGVGSLAPVYSTFLALFCLAAASSIPRWVTRKKTTPTRPCTTTFRAASSGCSSNDRLRHPGCFVITPGEKGEICRPALTSGLSKCF